MHIRYNETADLWEWLVSTGPEVWATLPINGSQITVGSINDARLSSNIPLKNAANTFSAANNIFSEILEVSKGLKFPATQVASSDANTFDDYEEGAFTPTLLGTGGQSGQVYGSQLGRYQKEGRWVTVTGYLNVTTRGTITGNAQIGGLPFVDSNAVGRPSACFGYFTGLTTSVSFFGGYLTGNSSTINLTYVPAAGAVSISNAVQGTFPAAGTFDMLFAFKYEAVN